MALLLLPACGTETGVLVEVSRDEASTPADMTTLEFVIGVDKGTDGRFTRDDAASIESVSLGGRDLASDPYQLLLRNGTGETTAQVMIAVFGYRNDELVGFAAFDQPQAFVSGQVLMRHLDLTGNPTVVISPLGCITWTSGDDRPQIVSPNDQDCDGDATADDCNDLDPTIGPSQTEQCDNDVDDNCNMQIDEETDADLDGMTNCAGDCDDNDENTHAGAAEVCDGKDNDCNDRCDDSNLDADMDNFNTCGDKIKADGSCLPIGVPDCDDDEPLVHPDAMEICNGVDDDCEAGCDVGEGLDADGDGFTDCGTVPGQCAEPNAQLDDCADMDENVYPFATELCDGVDTNCDGTLLQHAPCYGTVAADECQLGSANCDDDKADGAFGLAQCVPGGDGGVVPLPFCGAYDTCVTAMDPDPFTCANNASSSGKLTCQLFFTGAGLCGERAALLPQNPGATGCVWSLITGVDQDHYKVGLGSNGGGTAPSVTSCTASLQVNQALNLVPQPDDVWLRYLDEATQAPILVEVDLVPMPVLVCPMNGGLQCTVAVSPF